MAADEEFGQNLMQQVLELWINPEIERRREAGRLPDDFALTRAQVIMNLDANAPEVRFNKEIKAVAQFGSPERLSAVCEDGGPAVLIFDGPLLASVLISEDVVTIGVFHISSPASPSDVPPSLGSGHGHQIPIFG